MGKLIGKIAVFLLGIAAAVILIIVLSASNSTLDRFFSIISCSSEYTTKEEALKIDTIERAKRSDNTYKKLIVGDSVSYFMFTPLQDYNDEYFIGSTNRPFTMAGQYVVIEEFLKSHPDAQEVYLFFSKDSWESVIDPQCGYQNTVVPFVKTNVLEDLDQSTIEEMRQQYGSLLMTPTFINLYYNSMMNHKLTLNGIIAYHEKILGEDCSKMYETTPGRLSPLAQLYLQKAIDLCNELGVKFYLVHNPLADTEAKHAELEQEKEDFRVSGFMDIAKGYFDSVMYYPIEQFADGVHYGTTPQLQRDAIRDIIDKTGYMKDLVIEP